MSRRGSAARRTELLLVLACMAGSLWTYRRALGGFFSPDDLIWLERHQGILPQPAMLWPYLSGPAYLILKDVLDQGRALRALYPALDTVVFFTHWKPEYRDYQLYVNSPEGYVTPLGRGPAGHRALAERLMGAGLDSAAGAHLAEVLEQYPRDASLRYLYAAALARMGNPRSAIRQLDTLLTYAPGDSLAREAREVLRRRATSP